MSPDRNLVRALFADLEVADQRMIEQTASGYVVLVTDTESGKVVFVKGVYETAEAALIDATLMDGDPHGGLHPKDGSQGWSHIVVPLYAKEAN